MNISPAHSATQTSNVSGWNKAVFRAALILNGIVAYCILHADRLYVDDLGRVHSGYTGWTGDGRPLTTLIMQSLNMGTPLTDLTPLPQILAVLLLAWCAVLVARKFEIRDTATAMLAAFPLGASPFFLENLSYKFDVLTMVLAMTLAIAAICETPWRGRKMGWGALCLLGTLCLYQPSLNAFLVFGVLEFLYLMWRDAAPAMLARQALGRLVQVIAAMIPYKIIAAVILHNAYASYHATLLRPGDWSALSDNVLSYWELIREGLSETGSWPLRAALVLGLALALVFGLRYVARAWRSCGLPGRVGRVALALIVPAVLVLSAIGPLLFLSEAVIEPRIMVGIGALISASLVLLCIVWRETVPWPRLRRYGLWTLLALPAYSMLLLAAVYGYAMLAQNGYEHRISANLADDFVNINQRYAARGVRLEHYVLNGTAGYPPVLNLTMKKYPFLRRLVPIYLTSGWGWVRDLLGQYRMRETMDTLPGSLSEAVSHQCDNPPVRITANYQLYVVGSIVVVSFNNAMQCTFDQLQQPVAPLQHLGIPKGQLPQ
ncbi:MAG TPA: glucosyltransferase domain-containing protein [Bordetella sp.]|uniref:glucosyltransferase domain-containing protein n=1 Tax=Bordetella sp. TaxID=28081 RepID=UPI002ED220D7